MGDTSLVPDDGGTWGSLTTPQTVPVIRQACAAMRELLRRSAAKEWETDPAGLTVKDGAISGPDGKVFNYRQLGKKAAFAAAASTPAPVTEPASGASAERLWVL